MKTRGIGLVLLTGFALVWAQSVADQTPGSWVYRYGRPGALVRAGEEVCHPYENGFSWDRDNKVGLVFNGHLGTYWGLEAYWQTNYASPTNLNFGQIYNTNQTWLYSHVNQSFARIRPMDRPQKTCGAKVYYDEGLRRYVVYGGGFHATDNGYYDIGSSGDSLVKEGVSTTGIRQARLPWIFNAATRQWYELRPLPRGPSNANNWHGYGTNWIYLKEYGLGLLFPSLDTRVYAFSAWSNCWTTLQLGAPSALATGIANDLPMAYDCRRGRLILQARATTFLYTWETGQWDSVRGATGPVQGSEGWYNGYSAMTYDINADRALFLSHDGTATWSFDGETKTWTRHSTPVRPPNSGNMGEGFTYDPDGCVNVLFANKGDQVWTWKEASRNPARLEEVREISAVTTADSIRLTWAAPDSGPAPAYYRIYRAPWSDHPVLSQGLLPGKYVLLDSTPSLRWQDTPSKAADTFYSYCVQPVLGAQSGIRSVPAFTRRPVPLGLIVTTWTRSRVTLKWLVDTAEDVAGYHVYRAAGAVPLHPLQFTRLTVSPIGPRPFFEDATVQINGDSIFTYMVTTVNRFGHESGFSPRADTRIGRVMGFWLDTVNATLHWNRTLADTFKCYQVWVQGIGTFEGGVAPVSLALNNVADTFKRVTRLNHYKIRVVNALGQSGHFSDLLPYASKDNDNTGMFRGDGMLEPPPPDPIWDRLGLAPGEISIEAGLNSPTDAQALSARPNPFSQSLQIILRSRDAMRTGPGLEIFDPRGRLLQRLNPALASAKRCEYRIAADALPPGVYLFRIKVGTLSYTARTVKIQ